MTLAVRRLNSKHRMPEFMSRTTCRCFTDASATSCEPGSRSANPIVLIAPMSMPDRSIEQAARRQPKILGMPCVFRTI